MGKFFLSALLVLSFQATAKDFRFVGSYLLEYSIFKIDVYKISYFKAETAEKLVLEYQRPVKREHSIEGWKYGLKHLMEKNQEYSQKAQWFFDNTFDVEKGDRLSLVKTPESIELYKNEKLHAKTSDPQIIEIAFEPWLGNHPVDKKLKKALLGDRDK